MGKLFRFIAYLIGLLVVVVIAAAVIIPMVVDPNDYKPEISALVKESTGRELDIQGDIGLSVFPWLALELGEVRLSNAPGFGETPFAEVKGASVRVKLMPLLQQQLEMDTVTLDGLALDLSRNAEGVTNWDDLVAATAAAETAEQAPASEQQGPPLAALAVGGVQIRDARVAWNDQMAGQRVALSDFDLTTGAIEPGKPVNLETSFDLASNAPLLDVRTEIAGEAAFDNELSRVEVGGLRLDLDVRQGPEALRGTISLLTDVIADLAGQQYQAKAMKLEVGLTETPLGVKGDITLVGEVNADVATQRYRVDAMKLDADIKEGPEELRGKATLLGNLAADLASGEVRVDGADLSADLEDGPQDMQGTLKLVANVIGNLNDGQYRVSGLKLDADAQGESLPGGQAKLTLSGTPALDLTRQTLVLDDLEVGAYDLKLAGSFTGESILDAPKFAGTLKVSRFSPRDLLEALGEEAPDTADSEVLKSAQARLTIAATPDSADLGEIELILDDSRLSGNASVRQFAQPAVRFAMKLDQIDVDRYLPPPVEGEQEPAAAPMPAEGAAASAVELPVAQLRALDVDGTLAIEQLTVNGVRAGDVQVVVKAEDGDLRAEQRIGRLYQGTYTSDLGLNVQQDVPTWSLKQSLADVHVAPLLTDMTGKAQISGTTQLDADLKGSGLDAEAAKRSADGSVSFAFRNGAVVGINLARVLREAEAVLTGRPLPPSTEPNQTDFSELTGSLAISDGIVRNDDFRASSPLLRVEGNGEANLVAEEIDYLIKPVIVGSLEGQGGEALEELEGIPIPVRFTGRLDAPSWQVDIAAAVTAAQKEKLQAVKDKALEDAQEKFQKKIQEKLNLETEQSEAAADAVGALIGTLVGSKKEPDEAAAEPTQQSTGEEDTAPEETAQTKPQEDAGGEETKDDKSELQETLEKELNKGLKSLFN
jgi:AsmA protein